MTGAPIKPIRVPWTRHGPSSEEALKRVRPGHHCVVEHIPADFNNYFVTIELDFRELTDSGMWAAGSADLYMLKAGTYHRNEYTSSGTAPDGHGYQWCVNTANLHRQTCNDIIDVRTAGPQRNATCLNYQHWVSLVMDSPFTNVGTVVVVQLPSSQSGSESTGLGMRTPPISGVTTAVADTNDRSLMAAFTRLGEWVLGPGSAALWDCHVGIGCATATNLTPTESARRIVIFENMWLWVAAHTIDDPDLGDANNNYGTELGLRFSRPACGEHRGHMAPTPNPPAPLASSVGLFPGDPDYSCAVGDEFSGCDESWAVVMRGCEDIIMAGAGLYSWFSTYAKDCIRGKLCQKGIVLLKGSHASVRWEHLVTIGAKYMVVMDGKGIAAEDNLNVDAHPFWSQISLPDVTSDGEQYNDILWLDPSIWDIEQPEFSHEPPCRVKIPPYTGATTIINYPLMTVRQHSWIGITTLMGGYKKESIKPFSGREEISFSFEVLDGCSWTFSMDECTRYFKTPVDSCNCGG
ncbi:LysM domain-containing protein [Colletotrichum nymphaeae SA-01]|uniref:LysM domain-containing protein n=1 Tax=Colletotrichum nymphaeae SA-01 TaxID=1460502 RepID=A0A135S4A0_9PEZI|nr:LysM domain-containing protein [Colletotrichum nymphaeae SA-01]